MQTVTRAVKHAGLFLVGLSLAVGCDSNGGLGKGAGEPTGTAGMTGRAGGGGGAKANPTLGPLQSWTGSIENFMFRSARARSRSHSSPTPRAS